MKNGSRPFKFTLLKSSYVLVAVAILIIVGLLVTLRVNGPFKHKPTSASSETKGQVSTSKKSSHQSNPDPTKPPTSSNPNNLNSSGTVTLLTPTGDFVSNHHPNLSGSPAPNKMSSVCTTTPGASCTINFVNTHDQTKKSLPAKTADAGGSMYWDWKLQDIGLNSGTWHIEAVANLNSQAKTASDALDLVVAE